MSMEGCRIFSFPRIADPRGNLTFIEGGAHIPFPIARAYYLYDVPGGAVRGGHAHLRLDELVIAITGSFDVTLDDGNEKRTWTMRRSHEGLHIPPMAWRELSNFTSGTVCLVLASLPYSEGDYIRDYESFLAEVRKAHGS